MRNSTTLVDSVGGNANAVGASADNKDLCDEVYDEEPPSINLKHFILPQIVKNSQTKKIKIRQTVNTSLKTINFRKKFYPNISNKDWNSWEWQIANRIKTYEQASLIINLSLNEQRALLNKDSQACSGLPMSVTPYYMSLLDPDNPNDAIRRTVIPTILETQKSYGEADDPLGEDSHSPVHGLVHRYPDRVLFLVSDFCSTYCRYCTRSRMVGHGAVLPDKIKLQLGIDYIKNTKSIRDVLISGGDPLTLSDDKLDWLLSRLREIKHVEILRIGTKVPTVLPQRITKKFVKILKKYHPLFMSLHFAHPEECTPETNHACELLSNAGIPLGSQTVLLKNINDDVNTMKSLMHGLLKMRVRPYYIYQCDPISGSGHFRTPVQKGLEIIKGLRGFTSGYAVPTYVIDAPGGGGKIPLMPNYVIGKQDKNLVLSNYEGNTYSYPDQSV